MFFIGQHISSGAEAVRLGASLSAQIGGDPGARGEHTAQVSNHECSYIQSDSLLIFGGRIYNVIL